jgi:hypothetical protein
LKPNENYVSVRRGFCGGMDKIADKQKECADAKQKRGCMTDALLIGTAGAIGSRQPFVCPGQ